MRSSEWWELIAFVGQVLLLLQTSTHHLVLKNIPLRYTEEKFKARVRHARLKQELER